MVGGFACINNFFAYDDSCKSCMLVDLGTTSTASVDIQLVRNSSLVRWSPRKGRGAGFGAGALPAPARPRAADQPLPFQRAVLFGMVPGREAVEEDVVVALISAAYCGWDRSGIAVSTGPQDDDWDEDRQVRRQVRRWVRKLMLSFGRSPPFSPYRCTFPSPLFPLFSQQHLSFSSLNIALVSETHSL
jgi:hypothetical protein